MAAVALFRGLAHVMEWADPEVLNLAERDGRGMPVKEGYPEPHWRDTQAAMDEVYVTGRTVVIRRPLGLLVVNPRVDARGRIFGVSTWFQAAPAPTVPRAPEPRLVLAGDRTEGVPASGGR